MNVTESANSFNALSNWLKPESCQAIHQPDVHCSSEEGDQHSEYSSQPPPSHYSPPIASTEEADEEEEEIQSTTTILNSYSMEDLLKCETSPRTSNPQQRESLKRKSKDENEGEGGFIAELSRNAADVLTRALFKRTTFVEQNGLKLESELKGIVREALEASLENMSKGNSLNELEATTTKQNDEKEEEEEEEETKCIDYSKKHKKDEEKMDKDPILEHKLPMPSYLPPSTAIMDAIGTNVPTGFGQSFSVYYEAACRVLQMQRSPQTFQKNNDAIPPNFQKMVPESPRLPLGTRVCFKIFCFTFKDFLNEKVSLWFSIFDFRMKLYSHRMLCLQLSWACKTNCSARSSLNSVHQCPADDQK